MSKMNGDKARFGKERKKKMLRRAHSLALQQSLASTTTNVPGTPSEPASAALNQTDAG